MTLPPSARSTVASRRARGLLTRARRLNPRRASPVYYTSFDGRSERAEFQKFVSSLTPYETRARARRRPTARRRRRGRAVGARRREDLDAGSTSRAPAISSRRSVAPDADRTLEADWRETTAAARRARGAGARERRAGGDA